MTTASKRCATEDTDGQVEEVKEVDPGEARLVEQEEEEEGAI